MQHAGCDVRPRGVLLCRRGELTLLLPLFSAHLREFWEIQTRPLAANEIPALSTSSSPLSRLLGAIELRGLGGWLEGWRELCFGRALGGNSWNHWQDDVAKVRVLKRMCKNGFFFVCYTWGMKNP